jgi:putative sigma-54 modulation protein
MNVAYTGKLEKLYPAQTEKLEVKLAKLAKMLDGRGERQARVILSSKRGQYTVEVTVNYMDHSLVGICKGADQFVAITGAIDKLETQVLKLRAKRREPNKGPKADWKDEEAPAAPVVKAAPKKAESLNGTTGKVFRVNPKAGRKPMTVDEAKLELENEGDYVVFTDARKDCVCVLMRRADGNFDLIQS